MCYSIVDGYAYNVPHILKAKSIREEMNMKKLIAKQRKDVYNMKTRRKVIHWENSETQRGFGFKGICYIFNGGWPC